MSFQGKILVQAAFFCVATYEQTYVFRVSGYVQNLKRIKERGVDIWDVRWEGFCD